MPKHIVKRPGAIVVGPEDDLRSSCWGRWFGVIAKSDRILHGYSVDGGVLLDFAQDNYCGKSSLDPWNRVTVVVVPKAASAPLSLADVRIVIIVRELKENEGIE